MSRDPVQAFDHGGHTSRGSIRVFFTNKFCLSALYLLQCVDATFTCFRQVMYVFPQIDFSLLAFHMGTFFLNDADTSSGHRRIARTLEIKVFYDSAFATFHENRVLIVFARSKASDEHAHCCSFIIVIATAPAKQTRDIIIRHLVMPSFISHINVFQDIVAKLYKLQS